MLVNAQIDDDILYFCRNSSVTGYCQFVLFFLLTRALVFYSIIFIRKSMQWTREHDILLCREVLALELYKHKKGTSEAGRLWDEIAKNLGGCQTVRFKSNLSQRAVRERFNLIQGRFKENEKTELAASGISVPEQDELDLLLEDIAERERDGIAKASEKKSQEKATAEDIRNQALERMGQTKKRKSEEGQEPKERKSRRSSNEALQFMQEKAKSDMALRDEELKIRKIEEETNHSIYCSQSCVLESATVLYFKGSSFWMCMEGNQNVPLFLFIFIFLKKRLTSYVTQTAE